MLEILKKIVSEFDEVKDWAIYEVDTDSQELYITLTDVEAERNVNTVNYNATLYLEKEIEGQKYTGSASRSFSPDSTEDEIREAIKETIFAASLALNQYYELPEYEESNAECLIYDKEVVADKRKSIDKIKNEIIGAIEKVEGVRLSSCEIFIRHNKVHDLNSKGLDEKYDTSMITLDVVLLAGEGENEVESQFIRKERFVEILDVANLVERYAKYALDNIDASLPKSGKFNVIFTEEALDNFFDYYMAQVSGGSIYNKTSKFNCGDEMVKDVEGDKLTIVSDPLLAGGAFSTKYDHYGTALKKFTLIDENIFKNIAANKRMADYLNCPVTGDIANLVVKEGAKSFDELLEDNTFILSRFSTFTPNGVTGGFSGEIRNGLFYKDGKFTPVKGGAVTGMMDNAMKTAYFSKEITQRKNYRGPLYIKIADLDIAGE